VQRGERGLQGDGHRGDRAADQQPGRDAEGEPERQAAEELRLASGSRLATGSSRIISSGCLAIAIVGATWARSPPDSHPARWPGSRPSSSILRSASAPS